MVIDILKSINKEINDDDDDDKITKQLKNLEILNA